MQAHDNRLGRSRAWLLAVAALALALPACSAPTAGMWQGTADVGPIDAFPLVVMLPEAAQVDHRMQGVVELQVRGDTKRFTICSGQARNGNVEFEIDWRTPSCKTAAGAEPDRRIFRGSVGPGLITGVILKGKEQVGFFRAYRPAEG